MSQQFLRSLGTAYGYSQPRLTTSYADRGLLSTVRPVWRCWREVEPTINGLMAGSLALLLDPCMMAAFQTGAINIPLAEYLVGMWSTNLAAIFGDTATFHGVKQLLAHDSDEYVLADQLPDWYRKPFGQRSFDLADERKRYARLVSLLGAVAEAHVATGLTNHAEEGTEYMRDLQLTVATANGLTLPNEGEDDTPILRTVTATGPVYANQPRMRQKDARSAGVLGSNGILQSLLDADLGDGFTMRALYPSFGALVPEAVRHTLELTWTRADQQRFDDWASSYADRVQTAPDSRRDDWFDVAVKTRRG